MLQNWDQNKEKNREFPIRDGDLTKIGEKIQKKFAQNPQKQNPQTPKEFLGLDSGFVLLWLVLTSKHLLP